MLEWNSGDGWMINDYFLHLCFGGIEIHASAIVFCLHEVKVYKCLLRINCIHLGNSQIWVKLWQARDFKYLDSFCNVLIFKATAATITVLVYLGERYYFYAD